MRWFTLIVILAAIPCAAQKKTAKKTPAPAAPVKTANAWPIESIAVEGNRIYTREQVVAASGMRVGQLAGKTEFEAARDRLLATGLFETVGYRFAPSSGSTGYAAVFQVTEVEPVYAVRFDRLPLGDDAIRSWLKSKDLFFGEKIPATAPILERHARAIEELLASKGVPQKVIGKVVSETPEQFAIVFRPVAAEPAVAEVRFEGNEVVPSKVLLNAFAGAAFGAAYRETAFRQMLDVGIRPIYEARGRIRVSFPKLRVEKAKDVEGLVVTVTIDEGASFDLGEVKIAGNPPVAADALLKVGGFKPGDIVNFEEVTAGIERIRHRLFRDGYIKAELDTERKINDRLKTVDLTLTAKPGPQFLFGKLAIEGLDMHGEAAIKKMWALKEGKPFNASYPDQFLTRVREEGIFDELGPTKASTQVHEDTHTVDVTLKFLPAPATDELGPGKGRRKKKQ